MSSFRAFFKKKYLRAYFEKEFWKEAKAAAIQSLKQRIKRWNGV